MKKAIAFLLMALLMMSLIACGSQEKTESEATSSASAGSSDAAKGSGEGADRSDIASNDAEGAEDVLLDENGNVILSDPPTYKEILALHEQDPETYRDPGEWQPETKEMIRLEDGQWYQSFVASSYNCRFIFLSGKEYEMSALWEFRPIGSAENAFRFNVGAVYDNPSGELLYPERAVAVRGTLSEAPDGYAYQLQLPDELIVCLERPGNIPDWEGNAYITETDTLAIPEAYASLFEDKTGEVIVTGVVMQDGNGIFYLKDISFYLS